MRVHAAALLRHAHAHKAGEGAGGVLGRVLHGLRLRADQLRGGHVGIAEHRIALQLFDHGFVFLGGLDGADAEGYDFNAAKIGPLFAEYFVERIGDFHGVGGQGAVTDAHIGDGGEGGLQGGEQLGFELAVDALAGIFTLYVAAHVLIEQHGVGDAVAVFAKALDGDIHIQADVPIDHAEGHGAGRAVFVAGDLLGVEEIDALILASLAAKGEALEGELEDLLELIRAERPVEDGGFGVLIEYKLAGLGGELHNLALIDDHGALAFVDGDDGTGGDDVVILIAAAAEASLGFLIGLGGQHALGHGVQIEILLPLAGQGSSNGVQSCTNQSHFS